jgi:hypothetical protein
MIIRFQGYKLLLHNYTKTDNSNKTKSILKLGKDILGV